MQHAVDGPAQSGRRRAGKFLLWLVGRQCRGGAFVLAMGAVVIFIAHLFTPGAGYTAGQLVLFFALLAAGVALALCPILKEEKARRRYYLALLAVLPLLTLAVEQFVTRASFWALLTGGPVRFGATLLLLWLVELLAGLFTGSGRVAAMAGYLVPAGMTVVNTMLLDIKGSVLMPSDLLNLRTAVGVAQGYNIHLGKEAMLFFLVGLLVLLATRQPLPARRRGWKYTARRLTAFLLVAGAAWAGVFTNNAFFKATGNAAFYFRPEAAHIPSRSYFTYFLSTIPDSIIPRPAGYEASSFPAGGKAQPPAATPSEQRPHVLFIMNESWADLSVTGNFYPSRDPLPFYHALAEGDAANVATGHVEVAVFGGSTSCTEFEFLTGFSSSYLTGLNNAYSQYVNAPTPSLASYMASLGYTTQMAHAYYGYCYNRDLGAPQLGFSRFWGLENLPPLGRLRRFVSDESFYRWALDSLLYPAQDSPSFTFLLTMQNHGSYSEGLPNTISLGNAGYPQAEEYVSLLEYSDLALEHLLGELEVWHQPVVVVMFGDHWGRVESAYTDGLLEGKNEADQTLYKYQTPYVAWANYDVDLSGLPALMSVNYLGYAVLEAVGLPPSAYGKALLEVMDQYPVASRLGTMGADGVFYPGQTPAEEGAYLPYLHYIYNGLVDSENISWPSFDAPAAAN